MESSTAGPSSSMPDSSDSGTTTSSSCDLAAVDSFRSKPENFQEPVKKSTFESFHYCVGLPRPDFTRNYKITTIPPCGKHRSRGSVDTELKTAKPKKSTQTSPSPSPMINFLLWHRGHNGHFIQHNQYIS